MSLGRDLIEFGKRVVVVWWLWVGSILNLIAFGALFTRRDPQPASWLVLIFVPALFCLATFSVWRKDYHRLQVAERDDADITIEAVPGSGFLQVSAGWNGSLVPHFIALSLNFRLINRGTQLGTLIEVHVPEPRIFESASISTVSLGLFLSPSGGQHLRPGTTMEPGQHFLVWCHLALHLSDEVTPEALIDELRRLADREHFITWRFSGKGAERAERLRFVLRAEPIVQRLADDWRSMGHQDWATAVETPHL